MNNAALETIGFQNSQLRSPIPFDASAVATEDSGLLTDRHKVRALELGITEDLPYQPQASGFGYSAAGTARRLRELLEDPETFKTYAFVSALLCPDAGKQFRRLIHHQEFRNKQMKGTGRELNHVSDFDLEQRASQIEEVARELWWAPNATVDNIRGKKHFAPPQWTGDSPPKNVEIVDFLPSVMCPLWAGDYVRLVSEFGYDPLAAWTSIPHANLPPRPDRRKGGHLASDNQSEGMCAVGGFAQPRPYIPAPPPERLKTRYGKFGGGFTLPQVQSAISSRTAPQEREAVIEAVYAGRPYKAAAKRWGIRFETLRKAVTRTRKRIRQGSAETR